MTIAEVVRVVAAPGGGDDRSGGGGAAGHQEGIPNGALGCRLAGEGEQRKNGQQGGPETRRHGNPREDKGIVEEFTAFPQAEAWA